MIEGILWPLGIVWVLTIMSLGITLAKFGEEKKTKYGWSDLVSWMISAGLMLWITLLVI